MVLVIEVVQSLAELQGQVDRFGTEAPALGEVLVGKVRAVRLWVQDYRSGTFAPARFCGYRNLTVEDYVRRFGAEAGAQRVRGDDSRDAVRGLLGMESASDVLEAELRTWMAGRFAPESASRMYRISRGFSVVR